MNKKIIIMCIFAVFVLIAISFASAINTERTVDKKESPLFEIRTRKIIKERLQELKESILAKYVGKRVFFLPLQSRVWGASYPRFFTKSSIEECATRCPDMASCKFTSCCK